MTLVNGMRIAGLVALLAVAAPCSAEPAAGPTPQPGVQARIAEVVKTIAAADRGGRGEQIPEMADQLELLTDGDREALLLQLVLFVAGHPGNEPAMGAALLIDYYSFTDDEKIAGLTPHLGNTDARLQDAIWEVLATVDHPRGARESVQRAQQLELLLLRSEPGTPDESASVGREIDALSRDELWWIRLYAARVVLARPDLATAGVTDRLRADADPRVRQAAGG